MNPRPLLSIFTLAFRERIFYRFINSRQKLFRECYCKSRLRMAPNYNMVDLVVGDVISGQIAINGFYELGLSRELSNLAKKGGLMVDVGANLGYFSLLWLHGHPDNRVIAIEPAPRNVEFMRKNFEANGVMDRVTLLDIVAGDKESPVTFDLGPVEQTGWGGITLDSGSGGLQMEMKRIDSIIDEKIAVMKIDVEGADTLVLLGCNKLLESKKIDCIYFEQNQSRMEHLGIPTVNATDYLTGAGYKCIDRGNNEWMAVKERR
jgi:FkbM family methyltransferase